MNHAYEYQGYLVDVSVERAFAWRPDGAAVKRRGYQATVTVVRTGTEVTLFSPLRFGDVSSRPFDTEADALMGGYSAARKLIDDRFGASPCKCRVPPESFTKARGAASVVEGRCVRRLLPQLKQPKAGPTQQLDHVANSHAMLIEVPEGRVHQA